MSHDIDLHDPALIAYMEQAIGSRVLRAAVISAQVGHITMRGHRPYLHGDSPDAILFRDFIDWCLGDNSAQDRLIRAAALLGITQESLSASLSALFVPDVGAASLRPDVGHHL